ncbi:uncharacterized protein LAJ45_01435 [Morchella importuna]|uniref:RanBP2-type domain-containing protein n=1 Tax=Morchella conica CCBAS932 TaxID=1392247 RepID=A0A3N4KB63_9PEZI|nr:uncharacterized protein LAJ45_01435 [Morchella importuna]KAH8154903.1 hypothetical protein LAJ45_01435 [Morchella importuna]RPB07757.1 hypothetical protein P167DRAFT_495239 [Morchella conica CCBAS932]
MVGTSSIGDEKSIRKRFTASIKRVMSLNKSGRPPVAAKETPPISPTVAPSSAAATTPAAAAAAPAATTPAATTTTATPPAAPAIRGTAPTTVQPKPKPKSRQAPKSSQPAPRQLTTKERAQELFKKHGLEINVDWPLSNAPPGERVQKDIRMRVHRSCHKCGTTYTGADKVCCSCGHKRCTKCPRNPVKKPKDKGKGKEKIGDKITRKKKKDYISGLTLPSRTGGQDLVRKAPRQRIHRTCHRCQTDFAGEKVCKKCNHNRCKKCPREPFKKNKPPGYYDGCDPSDSERDEPLPGRPKLVYKKPRRRVHWTCTKCNSTFSTGAKICEGCGSQKKDTGVRDPPKKSKYKPSAEDLERLEQRLKQATLSD